MVVALLSTFAIVVFAFHIQKHKFGLKVSNYVYVAASLLAVLATIVILNKTRSIDAEKDRQLKLASDAAQVQIAQANKDAAHALLDAATANEKADEAEAESAKAGKDIASERQRTAESEQHVKELQSQLADRSLTDDQVKLISGKLEHFTGQQYTVTAYWESKESVNIANRIHQALQTAHWSYSPEGSKSSMLGGVIGVRVWTHPDADQSTKDAAVSLIDALNREGIETEARSQNPTNNPKHNNIGLTVGSKH